MGSTDEQVEAAIKTAVQRGEQNGSKTVSDDAERPQHRVVLTKPLAMSATVVTIGQFRKFIEATKYATLADTFGGDSESTDENNPGNKDHTWSSPGYAVTDESPVTEVSWMDAAAFCNWLCQQEKLPPSYRQDIHDGWVLLPGATGYRLPSEARVGIRLPGRHDNAILVWRRPGGIWPNLVGTNRIRAVAPIRWGLSRPIRLGSTICTAMWKNGARTGWTTIGTRRSPTTTPKVRPPEVSV